MIWQVCWRGETGIKSFDSSHTILPDDDKLLTIWQNSLLNTLSLCRVLKAPLSGSSSSTLPCPSSIPPLFSLFETPPTQLLNGKVCLMPAFTTVSVYSKLLSPTWDSLKLLLWHRSYSYHTRMIIDCTVYSTPPPHRLQLQREPWQRAHVLENACGFSNTSFPNAAGQIFGNNDRLLKNGSYVTEDVKPRWFQTPSSIEQVLLCTLCSTGNAPWPQIPWWMWNPLHSPFGISNLSANTPKLQSVQGEF